MVCSIFDSFCFVRILQVGQYCVKQKAENAHEDGIWALSWSERSDRIMTGSVDESVKVWRASTLEHMHTCTGHGLGVVSVAADPVSDSTIPLVVLSQHN